MWVLIFDRWTLCHAGNFEFVAHRLDGDGRRSGWGWEGWVGSNHSQYWFLLIFGASRNVLSRIDRIHCPWLSVRGDRTLYPDYSRDLDLGCLRDDIPPKMVKRLHSSTLKRHCTPQNLRYEGGGQLPSQTSNRILSTSHEIEFELPPPLLPPATKYEGMPLPPCSHGASEVQQQLQNPHRPTGPHTPTDPFPNLALEAFEERYRTNDSPHSFQSLHANHQNTPFTPPAPATAGASVLSATANKSHRQTMAKTLLLDQRWGRTLMTSVLTQTVSHLRSVPHSQCPAGHLNTFGSHYHLSAVWWHIAVS